MNWTGLYSTILLQTYSPKVKFFFIYQKESKKTLHLQKPWCNKFTEEKSYIIKVVSCNIIFRNTIHMKIVKGKYEFCSTSKMNVYKPNRTKEKAW